MRLMVSYRVAKTGCRGYGWDNAGGKGQKNYTENAFISDMAGDVFTALHTSQ